MLRACFLIFAALVLPISATAQHVSTLLVPDTLFMNDELEMDASGAIYGSHFTGSTVNKLLPDGSVSVFASGFESPNGLAFNSLGQLYVADPDANRIYKLSPQGVFLDTVFVNKPAGLLKMHQSDTLLVTSWQDNKIMKLAPNGSYADFISGAPLDGPFSMVYDVVAGVYYVGNFNNREIYRLNGTQLEYVATVPAPNTPGNKWLGSIVCANNTLWATSMNAFRIYEVNPNYTDSVWLFAGTGAAGHQDGPVATATFSFPNGLLVSPSGDTLYVTDYDGGYLRMITPYPLRGPEQPAPKDAGGMLLYPNPARDVLHIELAHEVQTAATLQLTDVQGRVLAVQSLAAGNVATSINVAHLPPGCYLCSVQHSDGQVQRVFVK